MVGRPRFPLPKSVQRYSPRIEMCSVNFDFAPAPTKPPEKVGTVTAVATPGAERFRLLVFNWEKPPDTNKRVPTHMDGTSPDKLGFKGRMLIFTALEKTYGRECAFDIATRSDDHMLKLVAIAAADEQAAQTLLHDLATLRQKREGSTQRRALAAPRQPRTRSRALRCTEAGPHDEAAREGAGVMRKLRGPEAPQRHDRQHAGRRTGCRRARSESNEPRLVNGATKSPVAGRDGRVKLGA